MLSLIFAFVTSRSEVHAVAMVSLFSQSVLELRAIMDHADEIGRAMQTAYSIEAITRLEGQRGYLVSALNNKDEICSIEVFIERQPSCGSALGGLPKLGVRLGRVTCVPRP